MADAALPSANVQSWATVAAPSNQASSTQSPAKVTGKQSTARKNKSPAAAQNQTSQGPPVPAQGAAGLCQAPTNTNAYKQLREKFNKLQNDARDERREAKDAAQDARKAADAELKAQKADIRVLDVRADAAEHIALAKAAEAARLANRLQKKNAVKPDLMRRRSSARKLRSKNSDKKKGTNFFVVANNARDVFNQALNKLNMQANVFNEILEKLKAQANAAVKAANVKSEKKVKMPTIEDIVHTAYVKAAARVEMGIITVKNVEFEPVADAQQHYGFKVQFTHNDQKYVVVPNDKIALCVRRTDKDGIIISAAERRIKKLIEMAKKHETYFASSVSGGAAKKKGNATSAGKRHRLMLWNNAMDKLATLQPDANEDQIDTIKKLAASLKKTRGKVPGEPKKPETEAEKDKQKAAKKKVKAKILVRQIRAWTHLHNATSDEKKQKHIVVAAAAACKEDKDLWQKVIKEMETKANQTNNKDKKRRIKAMIKFAKCVQQHGAGCKLKKNTHTSSSAATKPAHNKPASTSQGQQLRRSGRIARKPSGGSRARSLRSQLRQNMTVAMRRANRKQRQKSRQQRRRARKQ